jgi:anti-sigma factor RsiW
MTHSNDLSCKELVELVTEYLENSLPLGEKAQFEAHLALCPGCRTHLEQMRRTVHAVGHLTEESLDPTTSDRLLALFRNWKNSV